MQKLDFYVNPFNGNKFIGVFFDDSSDIFFMELYIGKKTSNENISCFRNKNDSEIFDSQRNKILTKNGEIVIDADGKAVLDPPTPKIKINKIFFKRKTESKIDSFLDLDLFFLYFYDRSSNSIYSVRKGIFNTVPILGFSFSITDPVFMSNSFLIPFYNANSYSILPALQGKTSILYLEDLEYLDPQLYIIFHQKGKYTAVFDRYSDSCNNTLFEGIYNCYRGYYFEFFSLGEYDNLWKVLLKKIAIIAGILILLGIIIFIFILIYYHKIQVNEIKTLEQEQKKKKSLFCDLEKNVEINKFESKISKVTYEDIYTLNQNKIRKQKEKFGSIEYYAALRNH